MKINYSYFEHPNSVCLSYYQHMKVSLDFSLQFIIGSLKALVHAFIPGLFITSTSDLVKYIDNKLKTTGCHK